MCEVSEVATAPELRGHHICVRATNILGESLLVAGVYNPCVGPPENAEARAAVLRALSKYTRGENPPLALIAGDFNAALCDDDRPPGTCGAADRAYRAAVHEAGLHTTNPPARGRGCRRTLRLQGAPQSRIDDVLTNATEVAAAARVDTHDKCGWDTNHDALTVSIPWAALGMRPPVTLTEPERAAPRRELCYPIAPQQLRRYEAAYAAECGHKLERLEAEIRQLHEADVRPHWERLLDSRDPRDVHTLRTLGGRAAPIVIEDLMQRILDVLTRGQQLLLETCDTRETNPGGAPLPTAGGEQAPRAAAPRAAAGGSNDERGR